MAEVLPEAKFELQTAKACLVELRDIEDFLVFKRKWNELLYCLEKVWKKAERECQELEKSKWEPFQGKYKNLRKAPLLMYLKQARDCGDHLTNKLVEHIPGSITLTNNFGEIIPELSVSLTVQEDGSVSGTTGAFNLESKATRIEAKPFYNNGKPYNPPKEHLGKQIKQPGDPLEMAEIAIRFYDDFLTEIEKKFF
ncbi:hypothetical protein Dfri01_59110 [Dyadobacter frigoris]|uniref:hypothetical protein n=1 Tax=Dyadobacter frigoris TaxID=2576211 RepID=UPI0024A48D72|nr:hypothetical protein [Dyadobacter frigoris]GLU56450.1 hypothetical protein Dfri01_59110 [Dyadobacter frigoris]